LDTTVACDATVPSAVFLPALLKSKPMIWCEQSFRNFSIPFQNLFICSLFNDTVSSSDSVPSNDRITNWREYGMMLSWPNLMHSSTPGSTKKNTEKLVRIAILWRET
jgi:hypothetical protein